MRCRIDTVRKVKEFTDICNRYQGKIFVYSNDGFIIDGKSVMGLLSLNLINPVRVILENEDDEEICNNFYKEISQFQK